MEYITRSDIARHLNIGESTLRRYLTEMKKQGYNFTKLGKMEVYTNEDYLLIEQIMELTFEENIKLEFVVEAVLSGINEVAATNSVELILPQEQEYKPLDVPGIIGKMREEFDSFKFQVQKITKDNAEVLERTERIEKKIDKRDEALTFYIRELQKEKKEREQFWIQQSANKKRGWIQTIFIFIINLFKRKKTK